MKGILVSIIVLLAIMFVGCDSMNPFAVIDPGEVLDNASGGSMGVQIRLPDFENIPDGEVQMAPAAAVKLYIAGNLFADSDLSYPDGQKTMDITSGTTINVRTVVITWFRVFRDPGGTVHYIMMKGPADTSWVTFTREDANGAYLARFTPDGHVVPVEPNGGGTQVNKVTFTLKTKDRTEKPVKVASDATSWYPQTMTLDQTISDVKVFSYSTYYPTGGNIQTVIFSDDIQAYLYTIFINGVEAKYLVKADGTNWHFAGEILANGNYKNSGGDNRSIAINLQN